VNEIAIGRTLMADGLREQVEQLRAFGEEERDTALRAKNREQYQLYAGWVAALDRVLALLAETSEP
jgi:hypothetical protein